MRQENVNFYKQEGLLMSIKSVNKLIIAVIVPCAIFLSSFTTQARICGWGYIESMKYHPSSSDGNNIISFTLNTTGFPSPNNSRPVLLTPNSSLSGAGEPFYLATMSALRLAQVNRLPVKLTTAQAANEDCFAPIDYILVEICSFEACGNN